MPRSWFRSALVAVLPRATCSRSNHSVEAFAAPLVERRTRPLSFETFEARRLLAADVMLGFNDSTPLTSPLFMSSSLTSRSSVSTPSMTLEKILPDDTLPEEIGAKESGPQFLPPPSRRPRDDNPPDDDSNPPATPTISLEVIDVIFQRPAVDVYESAILTVNVTLAGANYSPGNLLTVSADINFDGKIDAWNHSSEYEVLNFSGVSGRFQFHFFVPDDGPSPGNGTPTDKLTIRAAYGNVVATKDLTIKNLPPRYIAQPTFSVGKDAAGNSVARVGVQIADIGLVDVHTASVKWSDGIVTATQNFATIDNSCGPVRGRHATVERRLEPGQYAYPVEVRIADDDHAATADDAQLPSVKMLRLDLPLNDDDDNQSYKPDLAERLVSGEDDLRELDLTPLLAPQMTASGGKFYFGYDVNRLRVWDSADKQRLILPYTIEQLGQTGIAFENIPTIPYSGQKKVFVEGIADGQSSITLSWLSNIPYPIVHYPGCNPPIAPIPGGSITVTVWSIDLDIDSDNDNGFGSPESDQWEEYLEDSQYGIGKMVFPNAIEFTPVRLKLPTGLDPSSATIRIRLDASGSRTGQTMIWNTSKNDPNRVDGWLLPSSPKPYLGNKIAVGKAYSLDQLNYSRSSGEITLYLEALTVKYGNGTKVLVDDVGKDIDVLLASIVGLEVENMNDSVQWKNVSPGDFYPVLNDRHEIRNAIVADAVYGPNDARAFAMKLMSQQEVESLLTPFIPSFLSTDDLNLILKALFNKPSSPPQPPILALKAGLYMDHAGKNGPSYVLAFAGTELHDAQDILTNLAQFLEPGDTSYFYALHIGGYLGKTPIPLMTTGHSLGGGLASAASIAGTTTRGVPIPSTIYNGAGLQLHTLMDPSKSPATEYFPGSIAAFNSPSFIVNYTVWQNAHSNGSSDAPDVLTLLQTSIPLLPVARGLGVKGEGLYELNRDETLFLHYIARQLAIWYPDRESMLNIDFYSKAYDAFLAYALKILLEVDHIAVLAKIGESHRMPSVFYSLMHGNGWNIYDRTIVDND